MAAIGAARSGLGDDFIACFSDDPNLRFTDLALVRG
jgi:hypothetical protein